MNHPNTLPQLTSASTITEIEAYVKMLMDSPMAYHLDDHPSTICWGVKLDAKTNALIIHNHDIMITVCATNKIDIWELV